MRKVYIVTTHDLDPYPILAFDSQGKANQAIMFGEIWHDMWYEFLNKDITPEERKALPRGFGIGGRILMWPGYEPLPMPFAIEEMDLL